MEERNTILRNNLDTLYGATLAGAVCLILVLIPFVNLIAVIVALIAGIMIFVATYRLRVVHADYQTAFALSILNIVLTLFGSLTGGAFESLIDVISAFISFGQTYYVVRATNLLLEEGGHFDVPERGRTVVRLYVVNLVVNLAATVVTLITGGDALGIAVVLLLISLVVSIVAMVSYIKYLGAAKDRF